jgi:hypothetical protein
MYLGEGAWQRAAGQPLLFLLAALFPFTAFTNAGKFCVNGT